MNSEPGVPDPDQGPPTRPYGAPPPPGYGAAPPPGYGTAPRYGAAPPPAYGGPPPGAPPTSDETLWAVLSHVSFFVIALIGPLIVMLVKGNESRFVRDQAVGAELPPDVAHRQRGAGVDAHRAPAGAARGLVGRRVHRRRRRAQQPGRVLPLPGDTASGEVAGPREGAGPREEGSAARLTRRAPGPRRRQAGARAA